MRNALTIDVEEYFHPTEVERSAAGRWDALPSRVEPEVERVLAMLARSGIRATFFVLGWVAERRPSLVRRIAAVGHEIGCHSYAHRLVYAMDAARFRADTLGAADAIERACGIRPRLYRAPSYSITRQALWALESLVEMGFTHDSSVYPVVHDRYGIPGFDRDARAVRTAAGTILEVPGPTVRLPGGRVVAVGGGGYLRLLPYRYTAAGIRRRNRSEGKPACVYLHPWELDPDVPRLVRNPVSRLRTYLGLNGMPEKVARLLDEFEFGPLTEVFPAGETHETCRETTDGRSRGLGPVRAEPSAWEPVPPRGLAG